MICEKHGVEYYVKCPKCQPAPHYVEIEKPGREKFNGRKLKCRPWTPAPIAKSANPSPSTYNLPDCGGVFDPDAEKSLGRYHYDVRYYSKRVSDVDKSANKNNPLRYQIESGESYKLPERSEPAQGVDYGLELLQASFKYVDADGELRYNTKWVVRKLKSDEV
jgi:hypothetical protein